MTSLGPNKLRGPLASGCVVLLLLLSLSNFATTLLKADELVLDSQSCPIEAPHPIPPCNLQNQPSKPKPAPVSKCFTAAVFEHQRLDQSDLDQAARVNLELFAKVAQQAAVNGAKIIVFPEDGILYGPKKRIAQSLHHIPDPRHLSADQSNPCDQPQAFESSEILRNLSCIAKHNRIYVVANFGTRLDCQPGERVGRQPCPEDGFFRLNTDVIIDEQGNYVARYRKNNLFTEPFDKPPQLDITYIDSPYGRLGVFTCFDILFKQPAIELVEKHQIDTALFPTWWFNELPMLTAIQFQDAWSWTNRVNMLASNIRRPHVGSYGSGLYGPRHFVTTSASASSPRLLIAQLPTTPKRFDEESDCNLKPILIDVPINDPTTNQVHSYNHYKLLDVDSLHLLDNKKRLNKDTITACVGEFCCTLSYSLQQPVSEQVDLSKLLFIVRNTNRASLFNWFEQVCALVTLESELDRQSLNTTRYAIEPIVGFERVTLSATFSSPYVFPIAAMNVSTLIEREHRLFHCDNQDNDQDSYDSSISGLKSGHACKHTYLGSGPLYSFAIYGRLFDRDIMPDGWL